LAGALAGVVVLGLVGVSNVVTSTVTADEADAYWAQYIGVQSSTIAAGSAMPNVGCVVMNGNQNPDPGGSSFVVPPNSTVGKSPADFPYMPNPAPSNPGPVVYGGTDTGYASGWNGWYGVLSSVGTAVTMPQVTSAAGVAPVTLSQSNRAGTGANGANTVHDVYDIAVAWDKPTKGMTYLVTLTLTSDGGGVITNGNIWNTSGFDWIPDALTGTPGNYVPQRPGRSLPVNTPGTNTTQCGWSDNGSTTPAINGSPSNPCVANGPYVFGPVNQQTGGATKPATVTKIVDYKGTLSYVAFGLDAGAVGSNWTFSGTISVQAIDPSGAWTWSTPTYNWSVNYKGTLALGGESRCTLGSINSVAIGGSNTGPFSANYLDNMFNLQGAVPGESFAATLLVKNTGTTSLDVTALVSATQATDLFTSVISYNGDVSTGGTANSVTYAPVGSNSTVAYTPPQGGNPYMLRKGYCAVQGATAAGGVSTGRLLTGASANTVATLDTATTTSSDPNAGNAATTDAVRAFVPVNGTTGVVIPSNAYTPSNSSGEWLPPTADGVNGTGAAHDLAPGATMTLCIIIALDNPQGFINAQAAGTPYTSSATSLIGSGNTPMMNLTINAYTAQ
jgi:hypothetical protein